jgi:hypothetical protein
LRQYRDTGERRPAWARCEDCGWSEAFPIESEDQIEPARRLADDALRRHVCPPFKARPTVDRLWVSPPNPETEALATCCRALDELAPESAGRVLDYLTARYRKETSDLAAGPGQLVEPQVP